MKRTLAFLCAALAAGALAAADKAADKKDDKAAEKPAAEKAAEKPAAPAKKPAAKAGGKKLVGFEAYDAGPWKELDNRKGHLLGPRFKTCILYRQPVIVVTFDPGEEVTGEDIQKDASGKYLQLRFGETEDLPPRFTVLNVPSRDLTKDELATLPKTARKTMAAAGYPWYRDAGLEKKPESNGATPFFYTVSIDGKVLYAGNKGAQAFASLQMDLRKNGTEVHPLLGYVKPSVHKELCDAMAFGSDTTKIVAKLKKFASDKAESETKTEAQQILDALDQSKFYWLHVIELTANQNPPLAMIFAQRIAKTFPRDKAMFQEITAKLMANPIVAQVLKQYQILLACKEKLPEKKADQKKAWQVCLQAEKACQKARKSFGDNLPRAFLKLEELVMTVKTDLETAGVGGAKK